MASKRDTDDSAEVGNARKPYSANRLGKLLRIFRGALGISQKELAKRAGLHPSHVNRMEKGLRETPRRATIDALCAALGLSQHEKDELLVCAGYLPQRPIAGVNVFTGPPVPGHLRPSGETHGSPEKFARDVAQGVVDILCAPDIPEHSRRVIARQIRSFAEWLASESRRRLAEDADRRGSVRKEKI